MQIKELTEKNFDETINNSKNPVLVDFFASWCGPCKMLSPIIHEIAQEYGDRITVCSVNIDKEPNLTKRFDIMSIPTVMSFKNGVLHNKTIGAQSKKDIMTLI